MCSRRCSPTRRVGIADSEFSTDQSTGHVHLFAGCSNGLGPPVSQFSAALGGASFSGATRLFADPTLLARYDYVLRSREYCVADAEYGNVAGYVNAGGRLLVDAAGVDLFMNVPDWPSVLVSDDQQAHVTAQVDTSFAKGYALAQWLVTTGASTTRGELPISDGVSAFHVANSDWVEQWLWAEFNPSHPAKCKPSAWTRRSARRPRSAAVA